MANPKPAPKLVGKPQIIITVQGDGAVIKSKTPGVKVVKV